MRKIREKQRGDTKVRKIKEKQRGDTKVRKIREKQRGNTKVRRAKPLIGLITGLALVSMLFTGCQKGSDNIAESSESEQQTSAGTGRFLESELALPDNVSDIRAFRLLDDGSLEIIGENKDTENYSIWKSADSGESWEETEIAETKEYMAQAAIAPDGTAALLEYAKDGYAAAKLVDTEGSSTDLSIRLPEKQGTENMILQADYDASGDLIVLDMKGVLLKVHTTDGTCSEVFDAGGISINYFGVAGNILAAVHSEGIMLFDMEQNKMLDDESVLNEMLQKNSSLSSCDTDSGSPMVFGSGMTKDNIVFANGDGIFHFTRGGSVLEQFVDGSLTTLGSGNIIFYGIAMLDENHFFTAVNDGRTDKILEFSYDENASAVPDKELTVYALDESVVLRQAVSLFRKSHPDIYVNLEIGMSGEDSVTLEDALSVLNTDILAGNGPDVLILDGMPMESYIEKGILEDITDVVEEVDEQDGIFANIRKGSEQDGKIYAMPARFLLSVVEGDSDTVSSGESLAALADRAEKLKSENPDSVIMQSNKGTQTFLRDLYYADSARWQKEDGTLDKNVLTDFLANAKKLYDVDSADKESDYRNDSAGDGTAGGYKVGTHNSSGLVSGEYRIAYGSLASLSDVQRIYSWKSQTGTEYGLMNEEAVKSYIPYLMTGVNSGGNVETAKEFVKELLGKELSMDTNGFPVNRAAYDALCEEKMDDPNVKDGLSEMISSVDGEEVYGMEYVNLTQEDVDKITKIIESLESPSMTNRVIQELVLEQGDKYLLGEQGLEETVDAILQKVNLYLAE